MSVSFSFPLGRTGQLMMSAECIMLASVSERYIDFQYSLSTLSVWTFVMFANQCYGILTIIISILIFYSFLKFWWI